MCVQNVMLAMTPQTPPKWVQNSVFYDILNTFSPPGCLRYIVFYEVLLHISESRPSAPKTLRDSPRTSARPPRDAPRTPQDPPRTPPEPPKLVVFRVPEKLCKNVFRLVLAITPPRGPQDAPGPPGTEKGHCFGGSGAPKMLPGGLQDGPEMVGI